MYVHSDTYVHIYIHFVYIYICVCICIHKKNVEQVLKLAGSWRLAKNLCLTAHARTYAIANRE